MRAGPSWATLPGATQASREYSPVAPISSASLALERVGPWARPPSAKRSPQPPTQLTLPTRLRLMAGSTPLVSKAVRPLPVLNCQKAIWLVSWRPPLLAMMP